MALFYFLPDLMETIIISWNSLDNSELLPDFLKLHFDFIRMNLNNLQEECLQLLKLCGQ